MLNSIEPILNGARIFGCPPHKIINRHLILTKWGIGYSVFVGIIATIFHGQSAISLIIRDDINIYIKYLVILRYTLNFVCLIYDEIKTTITMEQLTSVFDHLHVYDITTKYKNTSQYLIHNLFYFIFLSVIGFWTTIGYLTYCNGITTLLPLYSGFGTGFFGAVITIQILKFCSIMLLVYQRLYHLNQLISPTGFMSTKVIFIKRNLTNIRIQDAWRMHNILTKAAEDINHIYSLQLFFWVLTMSLNGLSRIYTVIRNAEHFRLIDIRDGLYGVSCIFNLFLITISCHLTCNQANLTPEAVFSPQSSIQRKPKLNKDMEAEIYFCVKKLNITAAAGFIHLQLPLLISIAGTITTYLVILFDDNKTN